MAVAKLKTTVTEKSPADFIAALSGEGRRKDSTTLVKLMKRVTGKPPKMWGPSIIGFDTYHYVYDSGREGDICLVGFSPRSTGLVLYVLNNFTGQEALLKKLGKHKASGSCLHLKTLEGVDMNVLEDIVKRCTAKTKKVHG